jgi:hypothetical protein
VFSARTACLAALALAVAAEPAAAQLNVNVNLGRRGRTSIGTIGGFRPSVRPVPPIGVVDWPRPPVRPVPPIGDINWYRPPVRPVPPIASLRPTIYSPSYRRLFTRGYRTILVGNVAYYYHPALPLGATPVRIRGDRFYHAGGVWYQPWSSGRRQIFLVVPPPL